MEYLENLKKNIELAEKLRKSREDKNKGENKKK